MVTGDVTNHDGIPYVQVKDESGNFKWVIPGRYDFKQSWQRGGTRRRKPRRRKTKLIRK